MDPRPYHYEFRKPRLSNPTFKSDSLFQSIYHMGSFSKMSPNSEKINNGYTLPQQASVQRQRINSLIAQRVKNFDPYAQDFTKPVYSQQYEHKQTPYGSRENAYVRNTDDERRNRLSQEKNTNKNVQSQPYMKQEYPRSYEYQRENSREHQPPKQYQRQYQRDSRYDQERERQQRQYEKEIINQRENEKRDMYRQRPRDPSRERDAYVERGNYRERDDNRERQPEQKSPQEQTRHYEPDPRNYYPPQVKNQQKMSRDTRDSQRNYEESIQPRSSSQNTPSKYQNYMSNNGNRLMRPLPGKDQDRIYESQQKPYNIISCYPREMPPVHRQFPRLTLENKLIETGQAFNPQGYY